MLCLNVTAGIGVIGMASPLLQEVFGGKLIGLDLAFNDLDAAQKTQIAAIAAGFTGLLSLFNIGGRFFWASLSDYLGRKTTYSIFFLLGFALYASIPQHGGGRQPRLVRGLLLHHPVDVRRRLRHRTGLPRRHVRHPDGRRDPRPLADGLGDRRRASARCWSTTSANTSSTTACARAEAYNVTMYILAGLLVLGFICNWLIQSVAEHHHMSEEELKEEKKQADDTHEHFVQDAKALAHEASHSWKVTLAWLAVGLPLAWGFWMTLQKAVVLFR